MTEVVRGLPLRYNFFTAQKQAAIPWQDLYFPDRASYHIVNSVLFKRLEESLHEQTQNVIAQRHEDNQIHNISIMNEFPLNELKQVIEAIKPQGPPAPPVAGLNEAAQQSMRAEVQRMEAGTRGNNDGEGFLQGAMEKTRYCAPSRALFLR